MNKKKNTIILIFILLMVSLVIPALAAFSTSDLAGTWYGNTLGVGSWTGWEYSTATVNTSGDCSRSWVASDGDSATEPDTVIIDGTGIISLYGKPNSHGIMSLDKNFIVLTETWTSSQFCMQTYFKGGGSFSTSNLAGTWYGHCLITGYASGWERSTTTINSAGTANIAYTRSNGDTGTDIGIPLSISSAGLITVSGAPDVHGIMSPNKNFFIVTNTFDTGLYEIQTFVKAGGSFSTADMEGTWSGYAIVTGDWNGWDVSTATINNTGGMSLDWYASDGESNTGENYQLSITGNGIITVNSQPYMQGVMTSDKDIIIITDTCDPGEGEYGMRILVRQEFEPSIASNIMSYDFGSSDASEDVEIWNDGSGTLDYTLYVTQGTEYFSISPASGSSTGSSDKQTHTITVDRTTISPGQTVSGQITIQSEDADDNPKTISLSASKPDGVIRMNPGVILLLLEN